MSPSPQPSNPGPEEDDDDASPELDESGSTVVTVGSVELEVSGSIVVVAPEVDAASVELLPLVSSAVSLGVVSSGQPTSAVGAARRRAARSDVVEIRSMVRIVQRTGPARNGFELRMRRRAGSRPHPPQGEVVHSSICSVMFVGGSAKSSPRKNARSRPRRRATSS